MEPVEFVPLADEVLLPFDDRPSEVQGLMDSNRSLFKLIEVNFPHAATSDAPSSSTPWKMQPDPSTWTYQDFASVLGTADRIDLPDAEWARAIRRALKPRSEPLWEKLKGCLGIDEDDEGEDGEIRLVGESLPEEIRAGGEEEQGGRIFIEGLVEGEGVPLSEESLLGVGGGLAPGAESDRGARSGGSDDGVGSITGNFSPESAGDGSLPPLAFLAGGAGRSDACALGLGSIGEAPEDESPPPSRQTTLTSDSSVFQAAFDVNPTIRTTVASPDADPTPRSSFSFHPPSKTPTALSPNGSGLKALPLITTDSSFQSSPPKHAISPLGRTRSLLREHSSISDSPDFSVPGSPSSAASQKSARSKSFVGISILSSSPNTALQAPPLSPTMGGSSYTPSLDDASYGGRHIK